MPLNLIMLGPPGAGKGTQADRFARARGIPRISTGEILREAVGEGTEIGRRAKTIMDRGELVSDDVMIAIVRERIGRSDALNGFVLDGFPRTVTQATALDDIMEGRGPLIVVDIVVPEAELVRRLSTRMICADCGANADAASPERVADLSARTDPRRCRICGGQLVQRTDDNAQVVLDRLKVYHAQSEPLVEYYKGRPTFRSIDGAQPPDRVAHDLAGAVEAVSNGVVHGGSRR
jgi:adenylate kinase